MKSPLTSSKTFTSELEASFFKTKTKIFYLH